VGALTEEGEIAEFNPEGNIDIFAPGEMISTTYPGEKYAVTDGTSIAAPFVSGYGALLMSEYPNLELSEVKKRLISIFSGLYTFEMEELK